MKKTQPIKIQRYDPDSHGQCKCGRPGIEKHSCPYSADVHNDSKTKCNCCASCRSACAEDI